MQDFLPTEQERGNLLQKMPQVFGVKGWKNKVSRRGKIAPFLFHWPYLFKKGIAKRILLFFAFSFKSLCLGFNLKRKHTKIKCKLSQKSFG